MSSELETILRRDHSAQEAGKEIELPETVPEVYLGTVITWNIADGVKIQLDGDEAAMTKRYKQILTGRPLPVGARVAVLKLSGTYVVLGQVSNPVGYSHPENLPSDADLTAVISKVNAILSALRAQGVIWNP